jgi:hypothetical protein
LKDEASHAVQMVDNSLLTNSKLLSATPADAVGEEDGDEGEARLA